MQQFFLKNLRKTGHSAKSGDIEDRLQGMWEISTAEFKRNDAITDH